MLVAMANNDPLNPEEVALYKRLNRIWNLKRKELGLNQEKAAEMYGCSQGNISQYLNGKIPLNTDAIYKFSEILRVSPDEINPSLKIRLEHAGVTDISEVTAKNLLPLLEKLSPLEAAKFLGMAEAIVEKKLKENKPED